LIEGSIANGSRLRFSGLLDRHFHQITNDGVNIAPDVAHLSELRRLHLYKGRICELGEPPRDLGFANACWPDHQNVFWRNFVAKWLRHLLTPPPISQCDRHCFFRRRLTDNVPIQFVNNFFGSHQGGHKWQCDVLFTRYTQF
jgi:hypothetical protein